MSARSPLLSRVLLASALLTAAPGLAAQEGRAETLAARMQAFLREVPREPNAALVDFFPRRADWTWTQSLWDERGRRVRTGAWRFSAAETARAIGADGPVCSSFDEVRGEYGPFEGKFGMQVMFADGPWRRVGGNRFVPPGAPAGSPVFVEWQREDGRWVIAAFGDADVFERQLLGRPAHPVSADTSLVPENAAFAQPDWYTITPILGWRYVKYGQPRPLAPERVERIGVLGRVSVYVERGKGPELREIIYLPVAPGQFQPYEMPFPQPCR